MSGVGIITILFDDMAFAKIGLDLRSVFVSARLLKKTVGLFVFEVPFRIVRGRRRADQIIPGAEHGLVPAVT